MRSNKSNTRTGHSGRNLNACWERKWSQARGGTYLPSPAAYDGAIYALTETGILSSFDAKTGKLTYRTRIDPAATAFTTSSWAYNDKLFCLSEEGQTFVIATGEQFKLLRVNELG
ncbi:MAG: PQQ-like beta-propeller repeat protein [Blastocatellia bacterium]|nr:PQQ-like beta-propeller repeat protein [Blastocatellia bacterium]